MLRNLVLELWEVSCHIQIERLFNMLVILGPGGYASHSHHGLSAGKHDYFNRTRLTGNFLSLCAACYQRKRGFSRSEWVRRILFHNYNDVDFCLKLHDAGYDNVFLPHVNLIHHESLTRERRHLLRTKIASKMRSKLLLSVGSI